MSLAILGVFSEGTWSSAQRARLNSVQGVALGGFASGWTLRQDSASTLALAESARDTSTCTAFTESVVARSAVSGSGAYRREDTTAAKDTEDESDVRDYSIASAANRMTSVSEAEADVERMMMPHYSEDPVMDMECETRRLRIKTQTSVRDSAFQIADVRMSTTAVTPPLPPPHSSSLRGGEFTRNPIMIGD